MNSFVILWVLKLFFIHIFARDGVETGECFFVAVKRAEKFWRQEFHFWRRFREDDMDKKTSSKPMRSCSVKLLMIYLPVY